MGHKHRSSTLDALALRQVDQRPWSLVIDVALVLGVLTWIALRATTAYHPEAFAIYSAVLVGAIVHRIFSVLDRAPA